MVRPVHYKPELFTKFIKFWLPFIHKGISSFKGFIGIIEHTQAANAQIGNSHDTIGFCVKGVFEHLDSRGTLGQQLAAPFLDLFIELVRWHDSIHQSHL
jgi:hypothetical protein